LLLVARSGHHRSAEAFLKFLRFAAYKIKAFDDLGYFLRRERHTGRIMPFGYSAGQQAKG
jgi:hypothetical protein